MKAELTSVPSTFPDPASGTHSPAPGVLSITGERAELVVWERVVKVTVVGMVEHGFDALPEKRGLIF